MNFHIFHRFFLAGLLPPSPEHRFALGWFGFRRGSLALFQQFPYGNFTRRFPMISWHLTLKNGGFQRRFINGNSRILKWRYCPVPYKGIFCGDIPLHRPYIGLTYGRYLQFRFLKWPLTSPGKHDDFHGKDIFRSFAVQPTISPTLWWFLGQKLVKMGSNEKHPGNQTTIYDSLLTSWGHS